MWYEEIKSSHKSQKQNHNLPINFLIPYDLSFLQKDVFTHFWKWKNVQSRLFGWQLSFAQDSEYI